MRPTSGRLRETVFNICQTYTEGVEFLDLFAGSGAMGLEALSRGARGATFVDSHKESIRCIQQNVRGMHLEAQAQVWHGDVFLLMEKLAKQGRRFDIIFADPPYETWKRHAGQETTYSQHLLELVDQSPLLMPSGVLFLEESRTAPLSSEHLEHLVLHSSRSMGRSQLQQYVLKDK